MAALHDLIEVTDITAGKTYSTANGTLIGVIDGAVKSLNPGDPVNEFNVGDTITIGGVVYTITRIQDPQSPGSFLLGNGTTRTFAEQSETDLDVMLLSVSNGATTRHFILPSDRLGDLSFQSVTLGSLSDVGGDDARIAMSADNATAVVCFLRGTLIETDTGPRPIEDLAAGDRVATPGGLRRIVWTGCFAVPHEALRQTPALRPVRIAAGAFGPGCPARDLRVSRQHRLLVASPIARRMFGTDEVLVPANRFLGCPGVELALPDGPVTYHHILLDRHEILFAEGLAAESLLIAPETLRTLPMAARHDIAALLPQAMTPAPRMQPARCIPDANRQKTLIRRHLKNGMPFVRGAGSGKATRQDAGCRIVPRATAP